VALLLQRIFTMNMLLMLCVHFSKSVGLLLTVLLDRKLSAGSTKRAGN
jgi:hypothetical protein